MKLFLDTANVDEIREAARWGMLDGVTTNPTHVSKTGRTPRGLYEEICGLVDGPVSLETVGLDADRIVEEGRDLAKVAPNAVIKVPVMQEGLIAVRRLAEENIPVNVTTTFSPLQALLAAKAGTSYISPFIGRLDNIGHVGMDVVRQIKQIYDNYGFQTNVLVAAVRHPTHVLEAALAGADICTMSFGVLKMLYDHPLTDSGIQQFLEDWKKVPKEEAVGAGTG